MKEDWSNYFKLGIVHFMAYPDTIKGEGPILSTIREIAEDDFFDAIEISWIKDEKVREEVKNLLAQSYLTVSYGAQPRILINKLNPNAEDEKEREKAVNEIRLAIEEAEYLGAKGVAILSGPRPAEDKKDKAMEYLIDSLKQLSSYAQDKGLNFILEVFDFDIDKKALIGTSEEALLVAQEVEKSFPNFGLMMDLSHIPLVRENSFTALNRVKKYLKHIHLGNCVIKDKSHPAYGDAHPRFGIEGGENGVKEVKEFLQALLDIGYLSSSKEDLPIVSFEVKPLPGEESKVVIANCKRVLRQAWNSL